MFGIQEVSCVKKEHQYVFQAGRRGSIHVLHVEVSSNAVASV